MYKKIRVVLAIVLTALAAFAIIFNDTFLAALVLVMVFFKSYIVKFLVVVKKFFFKKGVVSTATIAWKRVTASSFIALTKRAIINNISAFFQTKIVKPLIHPLTRYLRVRWRIFKASNLWKKTVTLIVGTIPTSVVLWFVGIGDAIAMLMKGFSLAKFLTFILKFITMLMVLAKSFWNNWIKPYIDFILITVFVTFIEKIPVIGSVFRRLRIVTRWNLRKLKTRKKDIVDRHIDKPVTKLSERIHQHVDKQKETLELHRKQSKTNKTPDEKTN